MKPQDISINDYRYSLPAQRIAAYPLPNRSDSKLLVYQNGQIQESHYYAVPEFLSPHTLMVFNNTRVVEARVLFRKATGAQIEIFCLEPESSLGTIQQGLQQTGSVNWRCLIGGASKWKHGQILEKSIAAPDGKELSLQARIAGKEGSSFVVNWTWSRPELSFGEVLHLAGVIPLPPYIKRPAETIDQARYQTVYASREGSVAAPTAGLHFTPELIAQLQERGIDRAELTLHVGAGTFKPVTAAQMGGHEMHAEFIDVNRALVHRLARQLRAGHPVAAVGTTSMRTLESLYWLGLKAKMGLLSPSSPVDLLQWEAYELPDNLEASEAIEHLYQWLNDHALERLYGKTQLLIVPGYRFRIVDALVTNFHQPQSTLLLLVAAFIGNDWKRVYQYALDHDFRFLSYGDGCLLFRQPLR